MPTSKSHPNPAFPSDLGAMLDRQRAALHELNSLNLLDFSSKNKQLQESLNTKIHSIHLGIEAGLRETFKRRDDDEAAAVQRAKLEAQEASTDLTPGQISTLKNLINHQNAALDRDRKAYQKKMAELEKAFQEGRRVREGQRRTFEAMLSPTESQSEQLDVDSSGEQENFITVRPLFGPTQRVAVKKEAARSRPAAVRLGPHWTSWEDFVKDIKAKPEKPFTLTTSKDSSSKNSDTDELDTPLFGQPSAAPRKDNHAAILPTKALNDLVKAQDGRDDAEPPFEPLPAMSLKLEPKHFDHEPLSGLEYPFTLTTPKESETENALTLTAPSYTSHESNHFAYDPKSERSFTNSLFGLTTAAQQPSDDTIAAKKTLDDFVQAERAAGHALPPPTTSSEWEPTHDEEEEKPGPENHALNTRITGPPHRRVLKADLNALFGVPALHSQDEKNEIGASKEPTQHDEDERPKQTEHTFNTCITGPPHRRVLKADLTSLFDKPTLSPEPKAAVASTTPAAPDSTTTTTTAASKEPEPAQDTDYTPTDYPFTLSTPYYILFLTPSTAFSTTPTPNFGITTDADLAASWPQLTGFATKGPLASKDGREEVGRACGGWAGDAPWTVNVEEFFDKLEMGAEEGDDEDDENAEEL